MWGVFGQLRQIVMILAGNFDLNLLVSGKFSIFSSRGYSYLSYYHIMLVVCLDIIRQCCSLVTRELKVLPFRSDVMFFNSIVVVK